LPSKKPQRRFEDIVENIRSIERYTYGMNMSEFMSDAKTRDAVERCLERISEAVSKLGDTAPRLAPDQPWRQIRALGNRIRHEYDRLRAERIWEIVQNDLPALKAACEQALEKLRGQ
jgi:uncharacterized protein with HEPN domain